MKKSVLNWMAVAVAIVAISATTTTITMAQSSSVDVGKAFKRELKLVEGLKVYNDQLVKQLAAQKSARQEILESIEDSKGLESQVAPLLSKMLGALDQFVQADLPFHKEERVESIGRLQALMVAPEASTSDRFRNIMDIYTVETEYGNTYEAYKASLDVNGSGEAIEVDMLRIGRVALFYQTRDQKASGMWDNQNKVWKQLPSSANRNIRTAIKVAAKTVAPELLSLPISAPEGA